MQVTVLNGVNLNMLGHRDPEQYGDMTLLQLETRIYEWAQERNMSARCSQTNSEGAYVDMIHEAFRHFSALVNPGAWSHYSYAIRDALRSSGPDRRGAPPTSSTTTVAAPR
jgi:3-dehydroquinate dehydratase-2